MNRSTSVLTQRLFFTAGGDTRRGGWKAQCWRAFGGGAVAATTVRIGSIRTSHWQAELPPLGLLRNCDDSRLDDADFIFIDSLPRWSSARARSSCGSAGSFRLGG